MANIWPARRSPVPARRSLCNSFRAALLAGTALGALSGGAQAQTCTFGSNGDALLPDPNTFRFCVVQANTDGTIDTINSLLPANETVVLGGTVDITSSMTIVGNDPYTLFRTGGSVLSLFGANTLTIGPSVTIGSDGFGAHGIVAHGGGNTINLLGDILTLGDSAAGILALSDGNQIDISGSIATFGTGSHGLLADGGGNAIAVSGDIRTAGDSAGGILAVGGGNTIDVSGDIYSDGYDAHGIFALGSNNKIEVSGDIHSLGIDAYGIYALGGGNEIDVLGSIETTGNFGHGIVVDGSGNEIVLSGEFYSHGFLAQGIVALGGGNSIHFSGGIHTLGEDARGIVASDGGNTVVVSGYIQTAGEYAYGIQTYGGGNEIGLFGTVHTQNNGAHGIVATGGGNSIIVSGNIHNLGNEARGIWIDGSGNTIDLSGAIHTQGFAAQGIFGQIGSNVIKVSGDIQTEGDGADGIVAYGGSNTIDVSGEIRMLGSAAYGINAQGGGNEIVVSGDIYSHGDHGYGIAASGGGSMIEFSGLIETAGFLSIGIWVGDGGNEINVLGDIHTQGLESFGIVTQEGDTRINVAGSVQTAGAGAHGIWAGNGNNTVVLSGEIVATGADANAILFDVAGDNRLELREGFLVTGDVVGFGADTLTLGGEGSEIFDGDLIGTQYTGFSYFDKQGGSTWTLLGIGGQDWMIHDGTLLVNGTAGFIDLIGGALGGSGTVGGFVAQAGSVVAPGNSIGTLNVAGNLIFNAGSVYEVEIDDGGFVAGVNNDFVNVGGTATINGARVHVTPENGTDTGFTYLPGTYTILTAAGGVSGTFDPTVTDSFLFLGFSLDYDANNVYLNSFQTAGFVDVAQTPNQIAVAGPAENLGTGNPIFDALVTLTDEDEARAALDALSGEIHASAKTVLIEDSRFLREAANARIRAAFGEAGTDEGLDFWAHGFGARGSWASDGNAARLGRSIGGLFIGGDAALTDEIRLGLVGGYSRSGLDVDDRASSGSASSYHIGIYGGGQWGDFSLRGGASHSWHSIDVSRTVAFTGFADALSASYNARSMQVFGEAGYGFAAGGARFEPYVGLAHVRLNTDGFAETGGAAALSAAGQSASATFATLGVRAETAVTMGETEAKLRGGLAWRRVIGSVPTSFHSFASGSDAFTIAGVPLARDTLVLEAGFDMKLAPAATLGLSYNGQFGSGLSDHGLKASLGVKF